MLDELEKEATPAQRVEIDFSKITRLMRSMREATPAEREALLAAARKFERDYPTDRRIAALLTEVATLFDNQPKIKEDLLLDAKPLATDDELKGRIADDLKRVRMLGEVVPLSFTSVQGAEIRLADFHGKPVLIVFFGGFSSPSLAAMTRVQKSLTELPKDSVQVIGVCLDEKREILDTIMKGRGMTWPVAFDGKGWEGPLVRSLGINALPTIWLIDGRGRLRSLNASEGTASQIQQLLREK
jgi:peroxiredoxin